MVGNNNCISIMLMLFPVYKMVKEKNKNVEQIKQRLDEHLASKQPIQNKSRSAELILHDDEVFEPCYAETIERKSFPKYWFLSNYLNVVSLATSRPVWIKTNYRKDGSAYYKYVDSETGQTRNIEAHNLVALVFGSNAFGKANELLKQDGVNAFGVKQKGTLKVNGHHRNLNHADNDPDNIQLLTTTAHDLLHAMPGMDCSDEESFAYMKRLSAFASQECPNQAFILLGGDNDRSYHTIKIAPPFTEYLNNLLAAAAAVCGKEV